VNVKLGRAYNQTLRAEKTADNEERILDAAERLFGELLFDRVTLAAIASAAGVSVPTVQRRFGTKEEVSAAVGARIRGRVESQRRDPPVDDIAGALRQLVDHYEAEGDMTWHLLRQEADVPQLGQALKRGRAMHRSWVETVFFSPETDRVAKGARRQRIDALVAATDLFVWKLLRRDLGRRRSEVHAIMLAMVEAIAGRK
jgi:AcrR family transcriptional regulator